MAQDTRSRILQSSARLKKWLKVKSESRLIQEGRRQLITSMKIRQNPLSRDSYSTNKADRESTSTNLDLEPSEKKLHLYERQISNFYVSFM